MINICYELQVSIHSSYFISIMKYISTIENTVFSVFHSAIKMNIINLSGQIKNITYLGFSEIMGFPFLSYVLGKGPV